MLDTGCWILDAGYWILDTGYRFAAIGLVLTVNIECFANHELSTINYQSSIFIHLPPEPFAQASYLPQIHPIILLPSPTPVSTLLLLHK
jgi:hypothetical protein